MFELLKILPILALATAICFGVSAWILMRLGFLVDQDAQEASQHQSVETSHVAADEVASQAPQQGSLLVTPEVVKDNQQEQGSSDTLNQPPQTTVVGLYHFPGQLKYQVSGPLVIGFGLHSGQNADQLFADSLVGYGLSPTQIASQQSGVMVVGYAPSSSQVTMPQSSWEVIGFDLSLDQATYQPSVLGHQSVEVFRLIEQQEMMARGPGTLTRYLLPKPQAQEQASFQLEHNRILAAA